MRPQRPQAFQTDASRKLDRLELVAALLERDASQHRALTAELSDLVQTRPRRSKRKMPDIVPDWGSLAVASVATARATQRWSVGVVTSKRVRAALREAYDFAVDFTVVLGVAAAGAVILTVALLVAAPPV